ncbi:hypothetical protein FVE85_3288 [Porphyridium purpureum]|uniref:F-box domain-containing protein n=1 Tax=Porphyridium purpureum TaxID=35688 RepID=A0A5J4YX62_PORPP|nr:hypothetical protein FVE85_3288 [Porphyridium purpureum]|eukprot:POR5584..scf227_4
MDLPDEVELVILRACGGWKELLRLRSVCRKWDALVSERMDGEWRTFIATRWPRVANPMQILPWLVEKCKHETRLAELGLPSSLPSGRPTFICGASDGLRVFIAMLERECRVCRTLMGIPGSLNASLESLRDSCDGTICYTCGSMEDLASDEALANRFYDV